MKNLRFRRWSASWTIGLLAACLPQTATAQVAQAQNQVTIGVVLDKEWTDTGVSLKQGQSVKVAAHGTMNWYTGACNGNCLSTPAGIPCPGGGPMRLGLPCLSLLGRIGQGGRPFEIGESAVFTAPTSGEFFLGVNDDNLSDNSGAWTASISSSSDFAQVTARQQTTFSIPLNHPWVDTGVYLAQGQPVTITAQGTMNWYTGACDGKCLSTPAGIPCPGSGPKRFGLTCLSLIAVLGASEIPFYVGDSLTFTAPIAGELFLGVNDDNFQDNTGSWTATINSPIAFVQWAHTDHAREQLLAHGQRNQGLSPLTKGLLIGAGVAAMLYFFGKNSPGESPQSGSSYQEKINNRNRQLSIECRYNHDRSACARIGEPLPPDVEPPL